MQTSWVLLFIGIVVVMAIIGFLMKSFIKVIIILGVIYLLFHLGFIWGVGDLNEKLHLDKVFKPEVNQQIQEKYNDFTQKREANSVVETDLVKKAIDDSIQLALTKASNEVRNVDKEKLIQDISSKIQNFDTESVAKALDDLKAELAKYNVTPEEVQSASKTTQP